MTSKLQKWGQAIGVKRPKSILKKAGLDINSEIEIKGEGQIITIFSKKQSIQLKHLLSKITKHNLHAAEKDNYRPMGQEVW